MAGNKNILSPEYWAASEESPKELLKTEDLLATPSVMWPSLSEDSQTKQDSGYCSFTPTSSNSINGIFSKTCNQCSKSSFRSYAQSTPHIEFCSCKKQNSFEIQSSGDLLETISESKNLVENHIGRKNVSFIYDDVNDRSLYNDEMEVEESSEPQDFNFDSLEISEEQSIDFFDGVSFLSSKSPDKNNTNSNTTESDVSKEFLRSEYCHSSNIDRLQNETTPTKRHKPSFRNCASEVGILKKVLNLWSFKLTGIEQVDFFYQLGVKRSFPTIISKIFEYLSNKDIDSVRKVSKTWNDIVSKDEYTFTRWKNYKAMMQIKKENYFSPTKSKRSVSEDMDDSGYHFRNITNLTSPAKKSSPPTSPVSAENLRFYCNQKAVKKLKPGERLLPCPKCFFPSHDHGSPTVQCSRSGCQFRFCVWCRTRSSPSSKHSCHLLRSPRRSTPSVLRTGSKAFKRKMRRLSQLS